MYCYYVLPRLTLLLQCRGLKLGRWGSLGASYRLGADGVVTAAAACCGTSSWRDHAGWVPHALRDVGGAAPEARLQTQTCEVLRVPLDAVYTVGPGKTVQVPTTSFPSGFLLLFYLLRLGCRARRRRGGGGCRCLGCGGVCDGVLHAYSNGGGGDL